MPEQFSSQSQSKSSKVAPSYLPYSYQEIEPESGDVYIKPMKTDPFVQKVFKDFSYIHVAPKPGGQEKGSLVFPLEDICKEIYSQGESNLTSHLKTLNLQDSAFNQAGNIHSKAMYLYSDLYSSIDPSRRFELEEQLKALRNKHLKEVFDLRGNDKDLSIKVAKLINSPEMEIMTDYYSESQLKDWIVDRVRSESWKTGDNSEDRQHNGQRLKEIFDSVAQFSQAKLLGTRIQGVNPSSRNAKACRFKAYAAVIFNNHKSDNDFRRKAMMVKHLSEAPGKNQLQNTNAWNKGRGYSLEALFNRTGAKTALQASSRSKDAIEEFNNNQLMLKILGSDNCQNIELVQADSSADNFKSKYARGNWDVRVGFEPQLSEMGTLSIKGKDLNTLQGILGEDTYQKVKKNTVDGQEQVELKSLAEYLSLNKSSLTDKRAQILNFMKEVVGNASVDKLDSFIMPAILMGNFDQVGDRFQNIGYKGDQSKAVYVFDCGKREKLKGLEGFLSKKNGSTLMDNYIQKSLGHVDNTMGLFNSLLKAQQETASVYQQRINDARQAGVSEKSIKNLINKSQSFTSKGIVKSIPSAIARAGLALSYGLLLTFRFPIDIVKNLFYKAMGGINNIAPVVNSLMAVAGLAIPIATAAVGFAPALASQIISSIANPIISLLGGPRNFIPSLVPTYGNLVGAGAKIVSNLFKFNWLNARHKMQCTIDGAFDFVLNKVAKASLNVSELSGAPGEKEAVVLEDFIELKDTIDNNAETFVKDYIEKYVLLDNQEVNIDDKVNALLEGLENIYKQEKRNEQTKNESSVRHLENYRKVYALALNTLLKNDALRNSEVGQRAQEILNQLESDGLLLSTKAREPLARASIDQPVIQSNVAPKFENSPLSQGLPQVPLKVKTYCSGSLELLCQEINKSDFLVVGDITTDSVSNTNTCQVSRKSDGKHLATIHEQQNKVKSKENQLIIDNICPTLTPTDSATLFSSLSDIVVDAYLRTQDELLTLVNLLDGIDLCMGMSESYLLNLSFSYDLFSSEPQGISEQQKPIYEHLKNQVEKAPKDEGGSIVKASSLEVLKLQDRQGDEDRDRERAHF